MRKFYSTLLVIFMAAASATAQQTPLFTIHGHVVNQETGKPVIGQSILISIDSLQKQGHYNKVVTDSNGVYADYVPYMWGIDQETINVYTYDCRGAMVKGTGYFHPGKMEEVINLSICGDPTTQCESFFRFSPNPDNTHQVAFYDASRYLPGSGKINYAWNFGDSTSSTEQNAVHTYNKSGIYNVCLSINSGDNFCSNTVCIAVEAGSTMPGSCENSFWYYNDSVGKQYVFEGSVMNGQPDTWTWDFGDGTTATGQIVSHSFKGQHDTYKVCLTITGSGVDGTVCTSYSCQEVNIFIPSQCESSFWYQPDSSGTGYTFQGWTKNSQITSWKWDFGDGTTATGETVSHSFTSPGNNYQVCLTTTETDANGTTCTYSSCQYVFFYIPSLCESSFGYQLDSSGTGFIFEGYAKNSRINSWKWDFGDGTTATGETVSHSFTGTGNNYKVCLTTTAADSDSISCYYSSCQDVFVYIPSPCESSFWYQADSSGKGYIFTGWAKNSRINSWKWDFGDGTTATGQKVNHNFIGSKTSYTLCLTTSGPGADGTACTSTSCQDIYIYPQSPCENYFKINTNDNFIYTFSGIVNSDMPADYYWDFGDGTTANGQTVTHAFGKIYTVFNVCLTTIVSIPGSTGYYECKSISCQTIYNGVDSSMCKAILTATPDASGNTFHFANLSQGNHSYVYWDFGDGSQSTEINPSHTYSSPGIYKACLTIGDSLTNCRNQSCQEIWVNMIQPGCKASFYTFTPDSIPSSLSYMFVNTSAPGYTNQKWSFGDGSGSTEFNPIHTFASPGIYNACITIWDSNSNCQDTHCMNIVAGKVIGDNTVSGIVLAGNKVADRGIVWLISPGNNYYAEAVFDSTGIFNFSGVPAGSYYIYAMLTPGSSLFFGFMPTYYTSSITWQGATLITTGEPNAWYTISLVPSLANSQGNAVINGYVNWMDASGSAVSPAANVEIVLYNSAGVPVAYTFSANDGTYNFDNLPYGEYTLQAEMAGKTTQTVVINLSQDSAVANINFGVDEAAISPVGTNGYNKPKLLAGNPYPNPVFETLNLELNASASGKAEVEIIDIQGRTLQRETIKMPGGKNSISIGTGFLTKGVYLLRIHSQGYEPVQRRFIK